MNTKEELINHLLTNRVLKSENIIRAFKTIDRADFVIESYREYCYEDTALPIGFSQTISQPSTVAFMLELLQPEAGDRILDIGSGSGWTTALLASCVGSSGSVVGVEIVPELVEFGQQNLYKCNIRNAKIIQAQRDKIGYPDDTVFDKILVSAASTEFPRELISQFSKRLVIPIQNSIWLFTKDNYGHLQQKEYSGFAFVPLVKEDITQ